MKEQLEMDFSPEKLDPTLEKIDPAIARIFAQYCDDNGRLDYEGYVLAVNQIFGFVDLGDDSSPDLAQIEINFLNRRAGDSMSPES